MLLLHDHPALSVPILTAIAFGTYFWLTEIIFRSQLVDMSGEIIDSLS